MIVCIVITPHTKYGTSGLRKLPNGNIVEIGENGVLEWREQAADRNWKGWPKSRCSVGRRCSEVLRMRLECWSDSPQPPGGEAPCSRS